jgi:hypothetical protein
VRLNGLGAAIATAFRRSAAELNRSGAPWVYFDRVSGRSGRCYPAGPALQPPRAVATVAGRCNRRGPLQPSRAVATVAGRCNRRGPLQPSRAVATAAGRCNRRGSYTKKSRPVSASWRQCWRSKYSEYSEYPECRRSRRTVRDDRRGVRAVRRVCTAERTNPFAHSKAKQSKAAKANRPQICAVEVPAQMWPTDQLERACTALGRAWRWAVRGAGPTAALPCTTADGRCSRWYPQVLSGTTQDSAPPESRDVRRVKPFGASPSATGEHAMTDSNVPAWLSMHALHRLAQWQVRS